MGASFPQTHRWEVGRRRRLWKTSVENPVLICQQVTL